jgi:Gram-negative bacterial TonB protein C-terminal
MYSFPHCKPRLVAVLILLLTVQMTQAMPFAADSIYTQRSNTHFEKILPTINASSLNNQVVRDSIFTQIQTPAQYFGGEQALKKYLARQTKAFKSKQPAQVTVRFVVTYLGGLTQIQIVKGHEFQAESEEARRIVRNMVSWQPAQIGESQVNSYRELVLTFGEK